MIIATPHPKTMAAGRKYRNAGMPIRNITVQMMANSVPATPVPPGIFDTLICGVGVLSRIMHPLTTDYHESCVTICTISPSLVHRGGISAVSVS